MTNARNLLDVDEKVLNFINDYLIDQCFEIEPDLTMEEMGKNPRIIGIQMPQEQYTYLYNKKIPLMHLDLKLLIDGV